MSSFRTHASYFRKTEKAPSTIHIGIHYVTRADDISVNRTTLHSATIDVNSLALCGFDINSRKLINFPYRKSIRFPSSILPLSSLSVSLSLILLYSFSLPHSLFHAHILPASYPHAIYTASYHVLHLVRYSSVLLVPTEERGALLSISINS